MPLTHEYITRCIVCDRVCVLWYTWFAMLSMENSKLNLFKLILNMSRASDTKKK